MKLSAHFLLALSQARSVGIDVAKAKLDICCLFSDGKATATIANCLTAVEELTQALVNFGYQGMVVMESTSYYHWLVAVALSDAGIDVRLLNPLMSSKHAKAAIRKTKTDKADAYHLAHMALTEQKMPSRWDKGRQWVVLRHKVGALRTIEDSLQILSATLRAHKEALRCVGVADDPLLNTLSARVDELKRTRKLAEKELTKDFRFFLNPQRQASFASIPGVSDYRAGLLDLFMSDDVGGAKSWIAFTGLDISVRQSGNWQGRSRLSKRGNNYLRKCLYQMAWGAKQNDAYFRAYYERLRGEGRGYVESLLIIGRKILRIAYALSSQKTVYDPKMMMGY